MTAKLYTCHRTCILLCSLFVFTASNGQTIETIAGSGTGTYGADGVAATATGMTPFCAAIDAAGNIYIADRFNNRVRKINTSGIISTVAGTGTGGFGGDGGPATAAQFSQPLCVALDGTGNLYVSDYGNSRVRKVDAAGNISTVAGNGTPGYSGDGVAATATEIYQSGIAVDGAGNLYIADEFNSRVRKVNTSGIISTIAGTGTPGYTGDGGMATGAEIASPFGIALDNAGNIYFSDVAKSVIRQINPAGTITAFAGKDSLGFSGDGGPATAAKLNSPLGLAFDCMGNMYFSDADNNRIRKVSTSGIINTVAGNGSGAFGGDGTAATAAEISNPYSVAVDAYGNIIIGDQGNNRVRKVSNNDHAPSFAGGHSQSFAICENTGAYNISTLLYASDIDAQQSETWSVVTGPSHGSAVAAYSAISGGGVLTPAGLSYTPSPGYSGTDMFTIKITDCENLSDTTNIAVTINPLPDAGTISGADSVCAGTSPITLSETVTGGSWSGSNGLASVTGGGLVSGINPGVDTISYTVTNSCGPSSASRAITVYDCTNAVRSIANNDATVAIYPNPNEGTFEVKVSSNARSAVSFIITNAVGENVKEFSGVTNKARNIKLDVPAGVYYLSADIAGSRYFTKVVVE